MQKKIKNDIQGILFDLDGTFIDTSKDMCNALNLVLKENKGDRRLPIIIGMFEAQSIAMELEKIVNFAFFTNFLLFSLKMAEFHDFHAF